jgi:hypothetical protein
MIWLTWRQHRLQLMFGTAVLAVLLTFLLMTGFGISSTFHSTGLAACLAVPRRDCGGLSDAFDSRYSNLQFLVPLFLTLPALIGLFWGAPLVAREAEQGTHRLAWTQGVTRVRWLGVKLSVLGGATVAGAAAISWALSWWSRPLVAASDDRLSPGVFDLRGIVPVAYALFALMIGVAAGTIIRRTVPAMAAAITSYVAVRGGVALWLRQHFATPKTISTALFQSNPRIGHGDWVLSTKTLDGAGRFMGTGQTLDFNLLGGRCPELATAANRGVPNNDLVQACIRHVGLHVQMVYQPGSLFWRFQGIETGLFVALSAALFALTVYWVRRKVS